MAGHYYGRSMESICLVQDDVGNGVCVVCCNNEMDVCGDL
jgi:hypothetical protein